MTTAHGLVLGALGMTFLNIATTVQAQFDYVVTNGTTTVTRYTGSGGD